MSRLSTKQRRARRQGRYHARIQYTGCLHFENLPTEKETFSINPWDLDGNSVQEKNARVLGTDVLVSVFIINGKRGPVSVRTVPGSSAARQLIAAGYIPTPKRETWAGLIANHAQ